MEEALLGLAAVLATQATVDDGDGVAATEQLVGDVVVEVVQGVAVLGEDDDLLVGCGFGRVNEARAVGGLRLPGAVRDAGGREDGFQNPGQFAPLGVAGAADFGSQTLQALEDGYLGLKLGDGAGGGGLVKDLLADGFDFVLGGVVEVLDVVGVEQGHALLKRGGATLHEADLAQAAFQAFAAATQGLVNGRRR